MEHVVLVDNQDNEIGLEEKSAAHRYPAKRHRAFSIFILNDKSQLLLQKRSVHKKTWPGYWTNTCCSHPLPNELVGSAAKRRLKEELGLTCDLTFLFKFQYTARFDGEWGEHEIDHVFSGFYSGLVDPNPEEINDIALVDIHWLKSDIDSNPEKYTPWLRLCFSRFLACVA